MSDLLVLREYEQSAPTQLTVLERDALASALPKAIITAVAGSSDYYTINPQGHVGMVRVGARTIAIQPKIDVGSVAFMLSYSADPSGWRDDPVEALTHPNLTSALATPFIRNANEAIRRQVVVGYREVDDTSSGVRGRIRLADQMRRRQRLTTPVELTYDELSEDVTENRMLLAAAHLLVGVLALTDPRQLSLSKIIRRLGRVTHMKFSRGTLPRPAPSRLNQHYGPALTYARIILENSAVEPDLGTTAATGLIVEMSSVFEDFVHGALREALALDPDEFPRGHRLRPSYLDQDRSVRLEPDLSWWVNDQCLFVGDVKYKRTSAGRAKSPDIYQALAYAEGFTLDSATLIYAAGERQAETIVTRTGKAVICFALDIGKSPDFVLAQVNEMALAIKECAMPIGAAMAS